MSLYNAKRARSKRPCPLWVDAFQRDTQHLGADEVGAYMLILMAMWTRESCDFPADDGRLSKVARVSARLWKARIGPVLIPLFSVENGAFVSKRLRLEASFVERLCQVQHDRKAGSNKKSGAYAKPTGDNNASGEIDENSANHLELLNFGSTADGSVDDPRHYPSQLPNYPTLKEDDDDSAGAKFAGNPEGNSAAVEPTFRERILLAVGVDPVSGLTGFGGSRLGTQADMAEVAKWTALGLSETEIIVEVAAVAARKHGGPPSRLSYFSKSMADLAAAKARPVPEGVAAPSIGRRDPSDDLTKRIFAEILAERGAAP